MKRLDKYLGKSVVQSIALVTLLLTGLQIFILFVNQLGDVGKVDFGLMQAGYFVLMQLPYQLYLFFPMASLLGCLVGLGVLASHSELVVMRAAGMSIGKITWAVLKAALVLIVLVTCMGETLVPYMAHLGMNAKVSALTGGQSVLSAQGVWLRSNNDFISIASVLPNNVLRDVLQFRFDPNHNLEYARHLDEVRFENQHWVGYGIQETQIAHDSTHAKTETSAPWDVSINPEILQISKTDPDEMTLYQLYRFIQTQKQAHQNTHPYQLSLFQRIMQPLTTMVMVILAIPFIFGPLRSSSMGYKLLVGAVVGFGFHIINRFLGPVSLVFQWPPILAACIPTVLFALIGLVLMRRVR